jgi:hypothetical protein
VFTVEERDRVRASIVERARTDPRIAAGAVVGGFAAGAGDRYSDLDLTFGVRDDVPVEDVLADWTRDLAEELRAVHLFDVQAGAAVYRAFLLPGCLQVDLSFAPASQFGPRGPRFALLFGEAVDLPREPGAGASADELFGLAVHHAVRGRFCIERGRLWQAEYLISDVRNLAISLACLNRGLAVHHGRGADHLPADVRERFVAARIGSLDPDVLRAALRASIEVLVDEAGGLAAPLEEQLRELADG